MMTKIVQTHIVIKCKDVILVSVLSFFFFHEGFYFQREMVWYHISKCFAQMEVHTHVNPKGSGSRLIGLPILVSV